MSPKVRTTAFSVTRKQIRGAALAVVHRPPAAPEPEGHMKTQKLVPALLLLLCCAFRASAQAPAPAAPQAARHNLMPVPASVRFGAGRLPITR